MSATASCQSAAPRVARTRHARSSGSATNAGSEQASPSRMKASRCWRYSSAPR
jgi:hypothetical protein